LSLTTIMSWIRSRTVIDAPASSMKRTPVPGMWSAAVSVTRSSSDNLPLSA